jgi:hypothetical protein
VFIDKTHALNIDLTSDPDRKVGDVNSAKEEKVAEGVEEEKVAEGVEESIKKNMVSNNKRLMMEYRRIIKTPIEFIETKPLENNILEWHFVLQGNQDPYCQGGSITKHVRECG